jgi:SAM-dependent methyltransferase
MPDSVTRFSDRVENYIKFRPGYPSGVVELLRDQCGLTPNSIIADIGSGTGKLSEPFLQNGNKVFCVEPNPGMRDAAEQILSEYENFVSIDAAAESTSLAPTSIDIVIAGQAFHWFDQQKARVEFTRILKPNGWVALVWNERRLKASAFLRDYEALLLRFGTDYQQIRHENVTAGLAPFFAPATMKTAKFENIQNFDLEGLRGRILSTSYAPAPGHANFPTMMHELEQLFMKYEVNGRVAFEYDTSVYYAQLSER